MALPAHPGYSTKLGGAALDMQASAPASRAPISSGQSQLLVAARFSERASQGRWYGVAGESTAGAAAWLAAMGGSAAFLTACSRAGPQRLRAHRKARHARKGRGLGVVLLRAATGTATVAEPKVQEALPKGKPLQVVKIDLQTNRVIVGDKELDELDASLRATGIRRVAVVGVMGAYRTGKSFLLDLMLRYMNKEDGLTEQEECAVPDWAMSGEVPDWVIKGGGCLQEGRASPDGAELPMEEGFLWRPGMDKCTEGIWIWSRPFIRKARDGKDVAVLLMDTQGAWDAKMTEEQSATVFGLTTLLTSRLIYNISKQIQQDKIDNLVYFTDFARGALRTQSRDLGNALDQGMQPFQALDFLVRDWPHYKENESLVAGRQDMMRHLALYQGEQTASDTSMASLSGMFDEVDVWCLPHPSLEVEKAKWQGDLSVVEPLFWRFLNGYMDKIFKEEGLRAKTNLGTELTVDTFADVLRNFIYAFRDAAPQAKTFAEALGSSSSLLARDSALQVFADSMQEKVGGKAVQSEDLEKFLVEARMSAESEFSTKALFGSDDSIQEATLRLQTRLAEETERYRDENERRLESSLSGLTDVSLVASAAFLADRASDFTCDWWSEWCRNVSGDLFFVYMAVLVYVLYQLNNVKSIQGDLGAALSIVELSKSMLKRVRSLTRGSGPAETSDEGADAASKAGKDDGSKQQQK